MKNVFRIVFPAVQDEVAVSSLPLDRVCKNKFHIFNSFVFVLFPFCSVVMCLGLCLSVRAVSISLSLSRSLASSRSLLL